MTRCVNIDWLEVHVLEDNQRYPLDASFFRYEGWTVKERDYGTRVYSQMFTLIGTDEEPFIEIRRAPKSSSDLQGVLDPLSAHIRLTNRSCYFADCVERLRVFLARYNYTFRRIFRLDLCLDFELFDSGDEPQKFITRYLSHKYAKINQCNRTTRGEDRWDGCEDNYVAWGNPKSMVSTKLYNKTKELAEAKIKPYIIQSWVASNLITNPLDMTKIRKDGTKYTPTIWRLEFSIKSGACRWMILEDHTGAKKKLKGVSHELSTYDTKAKQLQMFASLVHHYFHFKIFEKGVRKDRCKDKFLFNFDFNKDQIYHLERIAQSTPQPTDEIRLRKALQRFSEKLIEPNVFKATQVVIECLDKRNARTLASCQWDIAQVEELQAILRRRLQLPEEDFQVCVDTVRRILQDKAKGLLF